MLIVIDLILCILVGIYWSNKGRSGVGGFLVSLFFTPIVGLGIGLLLQPDEEKMTLKRIKSGYKKCPYCAEFIKAEAKVCRYCGHEVPEEKTKQNKEAELFAPNGTPLSRRKNWLNK